MSPEKMKVDQTVFVFKSHWYKTMGQQGTWFGNGGNQERKRDTEQKASLMDRQQQETETGK